MVVMTVEVISGVVVQYQGWWYSGGDDSRSNIRGGGTISGVVVQYQGWWYSGGDDSRSNIRGGGTISGVVVQYQGWWYNIRGGGTVVVMTEVVVMTGVVVHSRNQSKHHQSVLE